MSGMLYQVVNKERALLAKQGRQHATDVGTPKPPKAVLRLAVKADPIVIPEVPAIETPKAAKPVSDFQTVGLHNVPKALVDKLKAEAKRLAGPQQRVSMTDVAVRCLELGLTELHKQDNL